jgi:homoprotocatechuate degradation regulator HpaR
MNDFERSLPMMLYRTLDTIMPGFRRIFAEFGLTEQQWRVLRVLWEQDQLSLLTLSQITLISPPSLVGVVDRLTRDELVTRVRSVTDRRVVNICLTAKGQALEEKVTPQVTKAYADIDDQLDRSQWHDIYQALDTLMANGR